ncbi:universal stress protein [Rubritalea marina]|uniref:universal stress protein n=1 Tax=Rubritalea marina TaxID=361055 RepID=UPI0003729C67|nr:universal stress protein [Rubritalea marina]
MQKLVVAIDFSPESQHVMEAACSLVQTMDCQVVLVHVVDDSVLYTASGMYSEELAISTEFLEAAISRAGKRMIDMLASDCLKDLNAEQVILTGKPENQLLDYLDSSQATMLVIGSHGHGALASMLLGSITAAVVKKSKIPVLVVPCLKDS